MSKYGYISLDMLYEYAMNTVDKTVSPNEFMRMPRAKAIPIEWIKKYKRVRGWEVTVTTQNAIDNMLNAWEKENEREID